MRIVEQIVDLIKKGKLLPGDKLPIENELTKKFGTSRSSVREALSALEVLGIIGRKEGKENIIRYDISLSLLDKKLKNLNKEKGPFELLEIRVIVEPESAGLAAERRTEKDLKKIKNTIINIKDPYKDLHSHIILCSRFHLEIARASHNSIILSIMDLLKNGMQGKVWENLEKKILKSKKDFAKHYQEHQDIFYAIKDKNINLTKKRMVNHLLNLRKALFNENNIDK